MTYNLRLGNTDMTGEVIVVATAGAPPGYLKCNGAAISRTTYAALFAVIGTTYGAGDGSTTFNVPETRGEFFRCLDDGRGVDSGRGRGTAQLDAIQDHTHYITGDGGGLNNVVSSQDSNTSGRLDTGPNNGVRGDAYIWCGPMKSGRAAGETRARNVAFLACIKY